MLFCEDLWSGGGRRRVSTPRQVHTRDPAPATPPRQAIPTRPDPHARQPQRIPPDTTAPLTCGTAGASPLTSENNTLTQTHTHTKTKRQPTHTMPAKEEGETHKQTGLHTTCARTHSSNTRAQHEEQNAEHGQPAVVAPHAHTHTRAASLTQSFSASLQPLPSHTGAAAAGTGPTRHRCPLKTQEGHRATQSGRGTGSAAGGAEGRPDTHLGHGGGGWRAGAMRDGNRVGWGEGFTDARSFSLSNL